MSVIDNIKELESKQKVMLVAIVLLLGVAVYMGYTTFFPPTSTSTVVSSPQPVRTPEPSSPTQTTSTRSLVTAPTVNSTGVASKKSNMAYVEKPNTDAPTPEQLAILAQSQQLQEEYIHLVSQYQIAQLEQKLATTNAAIAKQKLDTTKSVLATQKLEGNFSQTPTLTSSDNTSNKVNAPTGAIQVMFVGRQNGKWTAMLGGNGTYFEVNTGTRLPDGSVVSSISQKGVTLTKAGHRIYLAIPKTLD